jgi:hypothetical protein
MRECLATANDIPNMHYEGHMPPLPPFPPPPSNFLSNVCNASSLAFRTEVVTYHDSG